MANWYASSGQPAPAAMLQYVDASGATYTLTFDAVITEEWDEPTTITEHPVETGTDVADHLKVELVKCTLKVLSSNEPIYQSNSGQGFTDQPSRGSLALDVPAVSWTKANLSITYPIWDNPIVLRSLLQSATGGIGSAVGGTAGGAVGSAVGGLAGALLLQAKAESVTQRTTAGLQPLVDASPVASVDQWPGVTDYVAALHAKLQELKNAGQAFTVLGSKNTLPSMFIDVLSFSRAFETGSGENVTIGLKQVRTVSTSVVVAPIPNLSAGGAKKPANHGGQDPANAPPAQATSALSSLLSSLPKVLGGGSVSLPGAGAL
jgi:outer membrane lipoprotein SlyB